MKEKAVMGVRGMRVGVGVAYSVGRNHRTLQKKKKFQNYKRQLDAGSMFVFLFLRLFLVYCLLIIKKSTE